jgi:hypothetical protein
MCRLEINGSYRGSFKTPAEALAKVDQWARPFRSKWKILDPYGKTYAQG